MKKYLRMSAVMVCAGLLSFAFVNCAEDIPRSVTKNVNSSSDVSLIATPSRGNAGSGLGTSSDSSNGASGAANDVVRATATPVVAAVVTTPTPAPSATTTPIPAATPAPTPMPVATPAPAQNLGIVMNGQSRNYADGSVATSCFEYKNPSAGRAYAGATGDGTYTIDSDGAGGMAPFFVYCEMTTDGGGWTMIANVRPAYRGEWEFNAERFGSATLPSSLATESMVRPLDVDRSIPMYREVIFMDTGLGNWFVVERDNRFYSNNYRGNCGDRSVLVNSNFSALRTSRTSGATTLYANWSSGCPNTVDNVQFMGAPDGSGRERGECAFLNFDTYCVIPEGTRIRAFVR